VSAASDGPGCGSEFRILLPRLAASDVAPAAARAVAAPSGAARPERRGTGRRVLVVDDQPDSTDSLALLLQLRGHEVLIARDGPGAIEEAARSRPDVILLDLGLPGMSGYDVARRLRVMRELDGVRLVALTGYGTESDRQKSRDAGFDVHLTKPVDPQALDAVLARAG